MSSIFGPAASSSQQSSTNQAYPYLQGALSGTVSNGTGAGNQIANMLGLNGTQSQNAGFQNWQNSTGYQFGLNQGTSAITGNAATQGLLNSGSTLKALDTYGQNYANTQYQDYLNPLQSLLGSGLQAGGVLAGAGNTSQGSSTGQGYNGGTGGLASAGIGSLLGK
jgi:hypothetical protein